ncbi:MAG: hypothetical protein LBE02_03675 [Spirochaetaceae bacterium]|nr:hypothetical protein [Spirochaetaceae bacterium]
MIRFCKTIVSRLFQSLNFRKIHLKFFLLVTGAGISLFLLSAVNPAEFSLFGSAAGGGTKDPPATEGSYPFPLIYFTAHYNEWILREAGRPYWAATELEIHSQTQSLKRPLFLNTDIIAFYGHPLSVNMGILGRYNMADLNTRLNTLAAEYNAVNGKRGIRKALYIIYGTAQPRGEIGYISDAVLQTYIRFALEHDMLIFIDHQIGRYEPLDALKTMLPYLHYPNVHLALDPEWHTDKPMRIIGSITAQEINEVQAAMSAYLEKYRLGGERMLVIHQFDHRMIKNRSEVRTGYKQVILIHCSDGFGSPALKRNTYAYNAQAKNMPIKGFKLFYNFDIPGAGYDDPLLSPAEVIELNPRPYLIMYQ